MMHGYKREERRNEKLQGGTVQTQSPRYRDEEPALLLVSTLLSEAQKAEWNVADSFLTEPSHKKKLLLKDTCAQINNLTYMGFVEIK